MKGSVYILSNPTYKKDILKIGYTTRTIEERIDELSSTGVPTKFQLELCLEVDDAPKLEKILHNKLREHNYNKEFFQIPIKKAVEVCKLTLLDIDLICHKIYGKSSELFLTDSELREIENRKRTLIEKENIERKTNENLAKAITSYAPKFADICIEMNEILTRRMPKESNVRSAIGYLAILSVVGMGVSDSIFLTPEKKAKEIFNSMNPYEKNIFKEFIKIEQKLIELKIHRTILTDLYNQNPSKFEFVLWNDKNTQFGSDYVYNSPYVQTIKQLI